MLDKASKSLEKLFFLISFAGYEEEEFLERFRCLVEHDLGRERRTRSQRSNSAEEKEERFADLTRLVIQINRSLDPEFYDLLSQVRNSVT